MMADQELAEVHRDSSVHQVEEHEATGVLLLDADRQLVGEAADGLVAPCTERDVRVFLWLEGPFRVRRRTSACLPQGSTTSIGDPRARRRES